MRSKVLSRLMPSNIWTFPNINKRTRPPWSSAQSLPRYPHESAHVTKLFSEGNEKYLKLHAWPHDFAQPLKVSKKNNEPLFFVTTRSASISPALIFQHRKKSSRTACTVAPKSQAVCFSIASERLQSHAAPYALRTLCLVNRLGQLKPLALPLGVSP